jgi:hypothetical protein
MNTMLRGIFGAKRKHQDAGDNRIMKSFTKNY